MLTVVMTTRGRAARLAATLDAHARLEPPRGGSRLVVVVDGGCDATLSLLAARTARLAPGSVVVVPTPPIGQNAARNRALCDLAGDLVVFTDDDAIPRPDWLARLRDAADAHPEMDVIVGTVLPRFETQPPAHVLRAIRIGPAFARVERTVEGPVDPTEAVSPSFAVRASRFAAGLRFDDSIGPDGTDDYAMGSETELLLRLKRAGARAWYARDAIVEHVVTPAQIGEDVLLRRAYRYGRGRWRLRTSGLAGRQLRVRGLPVSLLWDLLYRRLAYARARRRGDPERMLRVAWRIAYLAGHVAEIRRERGRGPGLGAYIGLLPPPLRGVLVPAPEKAVGSPSPSSRGDPASAAAAGGA